MTYTPEATPGDELPAPGDGSSSGRGFGCALEIIETLVLTLVIYLLIHNFVAQPFEVEQDSMMPTVNPGEYVLIDKISPRFSEVTTKRGLASPRVHSALPTTRRRRDQLSSVDQRKSL